MTEDRTRAAQRRFLGLDLAEFSLVDSAAVEVDFLVTKSSKGSETMGAEAEPTESNNEESDVLVKALGEVKGIVAAVVKAREASADAGESPAVASEGGEKPDESKTENSEAGAPAKAEPAPAADSNSEPVEKSVRLTPTRVQAILAAAQSLQDVVASVKPVEPDAGAEPPSGDAEGDAAVTKAVEGLSGVVTTLVETLKSVQGSMKSVEHRVEAIEKARPAPNGESTETTEATETTKSASLWGGVL